MKYRNVNKINQILELDYFFEKALTEPINFLPKFEG